MLEIAGPVVADWQRAFAQTWRRAGGELGVADPPLHAVNAAGATGRVSLSEARQRSALANGVIHRIEGARARAWIMSAYFVPSRRFRKALRRAARRGVDVRLIVPGPKTDHPWVRQAARRFYGKMLRNGVRIFEYQPRVLHAKMIVCDDWMSIGSSNLDRWGFKWNLEANQEIENAACADSAARCSMRIAAAPRSSAAGSGPGVPGSVDSRRELRGRSIADWIAGGGRKSLERRSLTDGDYSFVGAPPRTGSTEYNSVVRTKASRKDDITSICVT